MVVDFPSMSSVIFIGTSGRPNVEFSGADWGLYTTAMSTSSAPYTEPWLRGTHTDVPAAGRAVLHALELALDDLTKWTAGLTDAEVHAQPLGLTPIAFHLRHIARATDRILAYAEGKQLSPEQLGGAQGRAGWGREAGAVVGVARRSRSILH